MLALKIEFLTGRYVASQYNDRRNAEWPPHPARVFSALVAALTESANPPNEAERQALERLECAKPPSIVASDACPRRVMTHYVPVNDTRIRQSLQKYRDAVDDAQQWREAVRVQIEAVISSGNSRDRKAHEQALKKAETALNTARAKLVQETSKRIAPQARVGVSTLKSAIEMLPEKRIRQARYFPSVNPASPIVYLIWECDMPAVERNALSGLAGRVVRIGHSSSLVHMTLEETAPAPNWIPDDKADKVLRIVGRGQLNALEAEWRQHRETEPRVLPCRFQRYRNRVHPSAIVPAYSYFSEDWIVFRRVGGPQMPIKRCADVASAFRNALLYWAKDPVGEIISGHLPDGQPTSRPHAAFVPLPFVGNPHADGRFLGIAVVLPRSATEEEKNDVFRAIGFWEASRRVEDEEAPTLELRLGRAGVLEMERIPWGLAHQTTLRPSTWCRPSRRWLSVTPVALDRNPGNLYARDYNRSEEAYGAAAETITTACKRIDIPAPVEVVVLPSATMPGTIKARQFPSFPAKPGSVQRVKIHAALRFAEPVAGPVLIGAGRFFGLGLFRPVPEEEI